MPPLLDIDLPAQNITQQALFTAIQHLDADLSWHLYRQLGKSRHSIPTSVIDLLITLQCRKPVRSSAANVIDSRAAVREVCDRVLFLCHGRLRNQPGTSSDAASTLPKDSGLSTLSAALSRRLLYLLVVEEEQIAASKSRQSARRRNNLASILTTLSANLDASRNSDNPQIDFELRGRLAASLSRLGATDAAYRHLELVVEQASQSDADALIDPRPFDQLLSALARQAGSSNQAVHLLPSPVDLTSHTIKENDPIIRALRLTLTSDIRASKANIHKCLQALDSATLWWLLPFELDSNRPHAVSSFQERPDDRLSLKQKWHTWQASANGLTISQDSLDSFAERVALVLAQRGILQPSLHIVDGLQVSHQGSHVQTVTQSTSKVPDHDFFTVILEKLTERMASSINSDARKSLDTHRGLSADLHLAFKVYATAHSIGVDLDSRLNSAIIKALTSCLPSAVADLGSDRSRLTQINGQIARRNEEHGSKHALKQYLRQFTTMVLGSDPDLSRSSLSYPAQATLLGLHMRVRDYSFTKRLYQLIRLRDPDRDLWSSDSKDSLQHAALQSLAAPDRDAFMWFFAESLRSSAKTVFAVQLHLDWVASGNAIPSSLNAMFVQSLLRAGLIPIVRRVLQELEADRTLLPARLARSLVASFADAGYPDLAMEMAVNVSQLTSPTYPSQRGKVDKDEASGSRDSWILVSTLKLMSVALDRSSRASVSKDGDLHRKALRLFEEFRLGLTHHLFMNTAASEDAPQAQAPIEVTLQDVRMAYNACMRASLSVLPSPIPSSETMDVSDSEFTWETTESTCLHMEGIFNELKDLGAEPDDDSWNLRLTSSLHACLAAPDQAGRTEWLRKALGFFDQASEQVFKTDGPLHASEQKVLSTSPGDGDVHRVVVHPAVVASIIDASRCCRDLESGLRVYEVHMRQSGFNVYVEKARLTLLAEMGEPHEWRNELQRLMQQHKSAFRHDEHFMKQLQMLSSAADKVVPR